MDSSGDYADFNITECSKYAVIGDNISLVLQYVSYFSSWNVYGSIGFDFLSGSDASNLRKKLHEYICECKGNQREAVLGGGRAPGGCVRSITLKYAKPCKLVNHRTRVEVGIDGRINERAVVMPDPHTKLDVVKHMGKCAASYVAECVMLLVSNRANVHVNVANMSAEMCNDIINYSYTPGDCKHLNVSAVVNIGPECQVELFAARYFAETASELSAVIAALEAVRHDEIVEGVPVEDAVVVQANLLVQGECCMQRAIFNETLMKTRQPGAMPQCANQLPLTNTFAAIKQQSMQAARTAVMGMFASSGQHHNAFFTELLRNTANFITTKLNNTSKPLQQ